MLDPAIKSRDVEVRECIEKLGNQHMNKKALSLPILTSLVVGNMIGTGIYILPASLASYGTISLFAWVFTSLGAMVLALTFAHLNKRFPKTGGPYTYCKEAYGR